MIITVKYLLTTVKLIEESADYLAGPCSLQDLKTCLLSGVTENRSPLVQDGILTMPQSSMDGSHESKIVYPVCMGRMTYTLSSSVTGTLANHGHL